MGSIKAIVDALPEAARKGPPCSVCALFDKLSGPEGQALRDLLANPEVQYTRISDGLLAEGFGSIESRTLARHARGQCQRMRADGRRLR